MKIFKRIGLAYLVGLVSITIATEGADFLNSYSSMNKNLISGIIFTALIILSFRIIRIKVDKLKPASIGLRTIKSALINFLIGLLPILVPFIFTILAIEVFNWGEVIINTPKNYLLINHLFGGLLFEAFPEEFLFRGYIYSNLNLAFSKRLS